VNGSRDMEITLRYPVISFLFATFSHSSEGKQFLSLLIFYF